VTSNYPPVLAQWLLTHFGSSPNGDAIIGDLNEQYQGSRLWYWRQALVGIVVSFFREISCQKLIAIRAILVGWIVKAVWFRASWLLFARYIFVGVPNNSRRHMPLILALGAASIAVCGISAWLVARVSGRHYRPMVLLYVIIEVLAVPLMVTVGWAAPYPNAAVLLGAPAEVAPLWAAPFAGYIAIGLSKLGYPFETVIALWCGSILMVMTMLLGGRIFNASGADSAQTPRGVV